ncbi:MAG: hypothetical protein ACREWE_16110 [Gammaproteobacteria bacterium]
MGRFWPGRIAAIDYYEPDGTRIKLFGGASRPRGICGWSWP